MVATSNWSVVDGAIPLEECKPGFFRELCGPGDDGKYVPRLTRASQRFPTSIFY